MPTAMKCPSCGAPLEVLLPGQSLVRCRFCSSEINVTENTASSPLMENLPPGMDLNKLLKLKAVKKLLQEGLKEDAVFLYRDLTGSTEEEAQKAVEAMAAGKPVVLTSTTVHQEITEGDPSGILGEIEKLLRSQDNPQMQTVGELLQEASQPAQVPSAPTEPAPVSPSPMVLPSEPVITNPMDAPASSRGSSARWIFYAVVVGLILIGAVGVLAFLLVRTSH